MAEVIWTEPALGDLDAIADYIALDDYDAATNLVRKIFAKVDLLVDNPHQGRRPKELNNTPYKRLVVNPAYIYYRIEQNKVIIVHIVRAEREFDLLHIFGS